MTIHPIVNHPWHKYQAAEYSKLCFNIWHLDGRYAGTRDGSTCQLHHKKCHQKSPQWNKISYNTKNTVHQLLTRPLLRTQRELVKKYIYTHSVCFSPLCWERLHKVLFQVRQTDNWNPRNLAHVRILEIAESLRVGLWRFLFTTFEVLLD